MSVLLLILGLVALVLIFVVQFVGTLGPVRGSLLSLTVVVFFGGGWWLLARFTPTDVEPHDWSAVASVSSASCVRCHPDHFDSWYRSFHRTMTRDATAENVKGNFDDFRFDHQGLQTRLFRHKERYYMETVDPTWALQHAKAKSNPNAVGPPRKALFSVDRLVGSHWIQEYMHLDDTGRFQRLPMVYHIVEKRWVPSNGAFLTPDSDDFWSQCRGAAWNDSCLYCHNTTPAKNPIRDHRGRTVGYQTEVAELGISCEACHGPAGDHVRMNHNPARRFAIQHSGKGDPTIVQPERLPIQRRDEICARCHGALVPKSQMWNLQTQRDPFIAGQELTRYNHFFWSESEQAQLAGDPREKSEELASLDGRFWSDGTPLTTALEYNGMALSACYQKGQGKLSCLSCHTMHGDDPNFMLKPGMKTNEACYQCHEDYRRRLSEHTRHPADSAGSLCYNCHMPHLVYSLLNTHRSHRIESPSVKVSHDTGKPHACNLCHLDKSLGWTQQQLAKWSGRPATVKLSADEESMSSALLLMSKADARTRVMVAGAFSAPAAQKASGTDWFAPFLTRLLEHERYPAVRYLAHRGLRVAHGDAAVPFDYVAAPGTRQTQLRRLQMQFNKPIQPRPHLPLTSAGRVEEGILRKWLKQRQDPDLSIHE